jgi:hypothetical protein
MNTLIPQASQMLRFFSSFKSVLIFLSLSLFMPLFFLFGTTVVDGFGSASQLMVIGGSFPIPFILINATYNTVFLISSLAVVMITFQFCEFILFGHVSHIIVGKIRNRLSVILSYLLALLIISIPLSFIFTAHYFAIVSSFKTTLAILTVGWMYTFSLMLITTLVLNFNALRKYALIMIILLFFVGPGTLMMISNLLKSLGGVWEIISYGTFEIYSFLALHFSFSRLIDFTISSSFFNWMDFGGLLFYIIPYIAIISYTYLKKDLA